jgi:hypothetical protein
MKYQRRESKAGTRRKLKHFKKRKKTKVARNK